MSATVQSYNQNVLEGCHEAVLALRALLAQEPDPLKRYKYACALFRARPVKEPNAQQPKAPPPPSPLPAPHATEPNRGEGRFQQQTRSDNENNLDDENHLDTQDDLDIDDDLDAEDAELDRQADEVINRIMSNPDQSAVLRDLHALVTSSAQALGLPTAGPESS
jgi:hypothetical protein